MPRTPEHRADMRQLVQQRKDAGLPVWEWKIDLSGVFHNESLSQAQRTVGVVRILRASTWAKQADEFGRLIEVIDGLEDAAGDAEEFNGWFDELYDLADYDRVWIKTR